MTTALSNNHGWRLMTFEPDQADVPAATRTADLLALARHIATVTDPMRRPELATADRILLAMALPNLSDEHAREKLIEIVHELHTAELAGKVEERDPEHIAPDVYVDSAAALVRDLVTADLAAGSSNVPMAGAR